MRAQRIDGDLLADQVARRLDRAVVLYIEAVIGVGVGPVVADHRLDRRLGRDQLEDRAIEGAADIDIARDYCLDVLRPAGRVTDPFELERRQIAEVFGKLGERHLPGPALVAYLGLFKRFGHGLTDQADRHGERPKQAPCRSRCFTCENRHYRTHRSQ